MSWLIIIPFLAFCLLLAGEVTLGRRDPMPAHNAWDWVLNLSGFVFQGAIIPCAGYVAASRLLPSILPNGAGILPLGWWGAFLLNFIFVDFLFYWQHRLFHQSSSLWKLHRCHHTANRVDVWVTSRNTLLAHFLFVYLLLNPFLGYLVSRPDAFFVAAALTASLDLFRHANLDYTRLPGSHALGSLLGAVFVLPSAHHQHHAADEIHGNYGANLILWDRWFGTLLSRKGYPSAYGVKDAPHSLDQLLYPLKRPSPCSTTTTTTQVPGDASKS
jgi:sterol desaturase/sphingolipid hydroxylase (fatty acid hydroxylase superfamily)